jgi:hypothetical protein
MPQELESAGEINSRVDRLLRAADAYGRFPTPVDDILEKANLTEADDYVLDESLIQKAPAYLRSLLKPIRVRPSCYSKGKDSPMKRLILRFPQQLCAI